MTNIKNFTNEIGAIDTLNHVIKILPELMSQSLSDWKSVKIIHDEPEVWRMWVQLGEVRLNLHRIASCSDPFFHFHPWPSIIQCVAGGYHHKRGTYPYSIDSLEAILFSKSIEEITKSIDGNYSTVEPGSIYSMTDLRDCHQVLVSKGGLWSSSIMITGKPYFDGATKLLSRRVPVSNPELTDEEKLIVLSPIKLFYGIS